MKLATECSIPKRRCLRLTVFTLAALLLSGCAMKPPVISPAVSEDTSRVAQDEGFDPMSLEEEEIIRLPESRLKSSVESGAAGGEIEKSGSARGVKEMAGFRVQIYSTNLEAEVRAIEQKALVEFSGGVYLIFDAPNYKVRVGDCINRSEAGELREKAIKLGYHDAWVVQSRIILSER